jgi:hypothetical protein
MDPSTGERLLRVTSVTNRVSGTELMSLGMSNKVFSASGQLVRVWGKVTAKTSACMTVDDGSGAPVRCQIDGFAVPISTPNIGDYVSVTGPAAYIAEGIPAVRVRSASDIQVY